MAAIKTVFKGVSTVVGEILVAGGALGIAYVSGFLKGSGIHDGVKEAFDHIKEGADSVLNKDKEKSEAEVNEEPQDETPEPETPPIEVSVNQQED